MNRQNGRLHGVSRGIIAKLFGVCVAATLPGGAHADEVSYSRKFLWNELKASREYVEAAKNECADAERLIGARLVREGCTALTRAEFRLDCASVRLEGYEDRIHALDVPILVDSQAARRRLWESHNAIQDQLETYRDLTSAIFAQATNINPIEAESYRVYMAVQSEIRALIRQTKDDPAIILSDFQRLAQFPLAAVRSRHVNMDNAAQSRIQDDGTIRLPNGNVVNSDGTPKVDRPLLVQAAATAPVPTQALKVPVKTVPVAEKAVTNTTVTAPAITKEATTSSSLYLLPVVYAQSPIPAKGAAPHAEGSLVATKSTMAPRPTPTKTSAPPQALPSSIARLTNEVTTPVTTRTETISAIKSDQLQTVVVARADSNLSLNVNTGLNEVAAALINQVALGPKSNALSTAVLPGTGTVTAAVSAPKAPTSQPTPTHHDIEAPKVGALGGSQILLFTLGILTLIIMVVTSLVSLGQRQYEVRLEQIVANGTARDCTLVVNSDNAITLGDGPPRSEGTDLAKTGPSYITVSYYGRLYLSPGSAQVFIGENRIHKRTRIRLGECIEIRILDRTEGIERYSIQYVVPMPRTESLDVQNEKQTA